MMFGGGGPMRGGGPMGAGPGGRFAGIPPDLLPKVQQLTKDEPETVIGEDEIAFSQVDWDRRPFTLRRFLRPYKVALLGALALVVVETYAAQIGPKLYQRAIDEGIGKSDYGFIVLMAGLYLASIVVNTVTTTLRTRWTGRMGENLMYDLRVKIFTHLQRLSLDFFTKEKGGVIMTRMTSDLDSLTALFQDGLVNMAVQAGTMAFVTYTLYSYDAQLASITLFVIVPAMTAATLWFRSASDKGYLRVRDRVAEVLSDLQESLAGMRLVLASNRQDHNSNKHAEIADRYRGANLYTAKVNAAFAPGADAISVLGQAVLLLVGGRMALRGDITPGVLIAFVLYLQSFFAPIQQLTQLYNTYQQGQAAVTKIRELLLLEPDVAEAPDAVALPAIEGAITVEHVTFEYIPGQPVLHDVSLEIRPGETFALVGATGSGKSTLAKLVTRFYDPTEGRVLIDGHDLRSITFDSLRRQVGVVPQEPFLFAGSVRDNIAFARPDATDDEVHEACRAVGIDELVARLPQGIDTPVHERGSSLSSGERQLLALARAFLSRPRVLVLDEATSSLDLRSESVIERALDVVLDGRTSIIIAHRLATAMRADRIAVVHQGEIVELGSHDELVALGGRYASMYATWEQAAGDPVH